MYASEEGHASADAKALSSPRDTVPLRSASYREIHARHKFWSVRSNSAFSDSASCAFFRRAVAFRFQRHVGWYPMYSLPSALASPSTAARSSTSPSLASESVKTLLALLDVRDRPDDPAAASDALEAERPLRLKPPKDEPKEENALIARREPRALALGVGADDGAGSDPSPAPFPSARLGLPPPAPEFSSLSVNMRSTSPAYVRGAKTPSRSRSGNGSESAPSSAPRVLSARAVPEPPRSSPTFLCPLGAREKSKPKKGPTGATPPRVMSDAGTGPKPRLAVPGGRDDQSTRAWSAWTTPRNNSGTPSQSFRGASVRQHTRRVSWFPSSASTSTSSALYASLPSLPFGGPSFFEAYLRFHESSGSRTFGNPHATAMTLVEHTYASVGSWNASLAYAQTTCQASATSFSSAARFVTGSSES